MRPRNIQTTKVMLSVLVISLIMWFVIDAIDEVLMMPTVEVSSRTGQPIKVIYPGGKVKYISSPADIPPKYEKVWVR